MKKILLLNDTSAEKHWGCQAAGGEILQIINNLKGVKSLSIYSVQYSWKFSPCPNDLNDALLLLASNNEQTKEIFNDISTADLVILNAEGTLLGNRPPVRSILLFLLMAIEKNVPFIILNSSINPYILNKNKTDEIIQMYRYILPFASLITVREARSYQIVRDLGATNVWHIYDSSLKIFSSNLAINPSSKKPTCIIFGSVLLTPKRIKRLELFLKEFRQKTNCSFTICSMMNSEYKLLEKLSILLNCKFESFNKLPLKELQKLMDNASFCISGRYHGCLLSACRNLPFIYYETHSNRIEDFCKHLCYEWGKVSLFQNNIDETNLLTIKKTWQNRFQIRKFLEREMPFLIEKSILQKTLLTSYWETILESKPNNKMSDIGFEHRAKIAASMLPINLMILDIGAFEQTFALYYKFKKYASIDKLYSKKENIPLGQPKSYKISFNLPCPDSHYEIDINTIKNFSFFGKYDVAVFLGVLPWIDNWQDILSKINNANIPMILISWDSYELNRVAFFMKNLNYEEIKRTSVSKKSFISLFKK